MELPEPWVNAKSTRWLVLTTPVFWSKLRPLVLTCISPDSAVSAADARGFGDRLAVDDLVWCCLGGNCRRDTRAHERNFHGTGRRCRVVLLVVLKLVALDAVHTAAVFAVQLNLYVMQQGAVVLELHYFGSMNLELRVRAKGM